MTRESADVKGRRYLTEGRVVVDVVGTGHLAATVRGDGVLHRVSFGRGGWYCTCPAKANCSHLIAVRLVTAPERRP